MSFHYYEKYIAIIALVICTFSSFSQNGNSNSILVRHDTTLLKASECEWIIKSLTKNNPELTSEIGKSVPLIILQAIAKGKLKAIDRETNKQIPGKQIYTWHLPADTMLVFDVSGNATYKAVQRQRSSDNIPLIRIYQDWYFDVSTGKFQSVIKWIELMEEIHTNLPAYLLVTFLCAGFIIDPFFLRGFRRSFIGKINAAENDNACDNFIGAPNFLSKKLLR